MKWVHKKKVTQRLYVQKMFVVNADRYSLRILFWQQGNII